MTDITRDFAWALAQVLDGVKEYDLTDQFGIPEDECTKVMNLLAQARAYLAKPEPDDPDYFLAWILFTGYGKLRPEAQRVLAAHGIAQSEPEGPTDEALLAIAAASIDPYQDSGIAIGEYEPETEHALEVYGSELIAFARAVLARWGK